MAKKKPASSATAKRPPRRRLSNKATPDVFRVPNAGDKIRIHHGDCVRELSKIDDNSIPLAFVDPPYNIGYEYSIYQDKRKPHDYLDWCREWIAELYRVTAKAGTCWIAIGDEFVSEMDVLAKEAGFYKRSHVVWYFTFSLYCPKNFARSHTHLLYYTKSKTKFTFNKDDSNVRVPSSRQLIYNDARANPAGRLPDNTWVLLPDDLEKAFSRGEDTWLESRICGTFKERHDRGVDGGRKGCPQMPQAVMNRIVLACSNPGDVVLDPMSGTFATGEAAIRNGRQFIGIELSEDYVASGYARMKSVFASLGA